ncbi:MAG: hypothetical protein R6U32_02675 [Candidatus Woesearchaeota archaeon]
MKITIDTKEDSHEEIRKVLKMLEAWIEGHTNAPASGGEQGSDSGVSGPMDIFGMVNIPDAGAGQSAGEAGGQPEGWSSGQKDGQAQPVGPSAGQGSQGQGTDIFSLFDDDGGSGSASADDSSDASSGSYSSSSGSSDTSKTEDNSDDVPPVITY